jgi:hypothetical protein
MAVWRFTQHCGTLTANSHALRVRQFKEDVMKKAYAAPTLVPSGDVVRGTLNGSSTSSEGGNFKSDITGGAGYYL